MTHSIAQRWQFDLPTLSDDAYDQALTSTIRDYVAERSPVSFLDLLRACKGAFPTVVMEHVTRMCADVQWTNMAALASGTTAHHPSRLSNIEGNPVLSSWYFSSTTCEHIAALRDWSTKRLGFLGTPRLYEWFAERRLGQRRVLFELDATVLGALADLATRDGDSHVTYDTRRTLPETFIDSFDYVFFDPPWYPEHYAIWLRRASQLAPHGTVIFPLFPRLTRPSAAAERNAIVGPLHTAGANIWTISAYAEYVVPSFERAELRAAGLENVDLWKAADVIIADLARVTTAVAVAEPGLGDASR
jgi:hypothetical protein